MKYQYYFSILLLLIISSCKQSNTNSQNNQISYSMTAKELLLEYLQNIQKPQKEVELFAEDGAIELPYFKSVSIPPRYQGKKEIETFISTSSNFAVELNDGWTMVGNNGGYMAQREHTIILL